MELKNRRTVSTQYIKVDRFLYKTLNIYYYIVRWFKVRVMSEYVTYILTGTPRLSNLKLSRIFF